MHPSNYHALGLKWKFGKDKHYSYFVDTRLPFGSKSSPGIFHRITQAVRRMMELRGFQVVVYLDDFLIIAPTLAQCQDGYNTLSTLLCDLGFQLSQHKLVPPCQSLVFLGVLIDTVTLTVSLPEDKLIQLKGEIKIFLSKTWSSKRQLQQLAGRLNWACKVVYGGRTFLRRVLDQMNTLPSPASRCHLSPEFHRDMEWWDQFLLCFNGQCEFFADRPITDLQTDACSTGVGAYYRGDWLYYNFLAECPSHLELHINYKEAISIVFAALRWSAAWANHKVIVYCDNTAAVAMINKGSTKNPFMMGFLRLLFCSA